MNTKNKKIIKNTKKSSAMHFLDKIAGSELNFSNMLVSIRESEEISQIQFAKTLGISRQNLCDIEKGRKGISPARAASFAGILGYSEEVFVMLALQDKVDRDGLKLRVFIRSATMSTLT